MEGKGCFYFDYEVPAAVGAVGVLASALNPEGKDLLITRVVILNKEAGAGATAIDGGVGANEAGAKNNIFAANAAAQVAGAIQDSADDTVAELTSIIWEGAHWLTMTKQDGAGNSEIGMAGTVYVEYIGI